MIILYIQTTPTGQGHYSRLVLSDEIIVTEAELRQVGGGKKRATRRN